jgi:hypothetical protein
VGLARDDLVDASDAAEAVALVDGLIQRLAREGRRELLGLAERADVEVGRERARLRDVGQAGLRIAHDRERASLDQCVVGVVAVLSKPQRSRSHTIAD